MAAIGGIAASRRRGVAATQHCIIAQLVLDSRHSVRRCSAIPVPVSWEVPIDIAMVEALSADALVSANDTPRGSFTPAHSRPPWPAARAPVREVDVNPRVREQPRSPSRACARTVLAGSGRARQPDGQDLRCAPYAASLSANAFHVQGSSSSIRLIGWLAIRAKMSRK